MTDEYPKGQTPLTPRERRYSYAVWGAWLGAFLALEFLGWKSKKAPWRTLSETSWALEGRWKLLKILADGGLEVLKTHIINPYWPGNGPPGGYT